MRSVSGEQVFMPLREIRELERWGWERPTPLLFLILQLSWNHLQFFPPYSHLWSLFFSSFLSFLALLLPTQLSHHPLSCSVFFLQIYPPWCHRCASFCASKSSPHNILSTHLSSFCVLLEGFYSSRMLDSSIISNNHIHTYAYMSFVILNLYRWLQAWKTFHSSFYLHRLQ